MARKLTFGLVLVLAAAHFAAAASYQQILTWEQVKGDGGSRAHYGTLIEGNTAYNFLTLTDTSYPNDAGRITKLTNIDGAPVYTELLSTMDWAIASGSTNMTGFYGYGVSGDYLQFAETGAHSVWRVHKETGAISSYVSRAEIMAYTGLGNARVGSLQTVGPDGEHYFYERDTASFLRTQGQGTVETFISNAQMIDVAGSDAASGGITIGGDGALYWGNNSASEIYKWNGTGSVVLTAAQIAAVTGNASTILLADIFYAPDGKVYFGENRSRAILSFDPADPAGTLGVVLNEQQLLAGPGESTSLSQFSWYNGNIGWAQVAPTANKGFYAVPEPATMGLLVLGGLAVIRRRRA